MVYNNIKDKEIIKYNKNGNRKNIKKERGIFMINKKLQKIISMGIIATTMLIPTMANAEWKQDNTGWWYKEGKSYIQNGWKLINNNWYYFDNNGYMKTGWIQDTNGKWYYLSQSGSMLSNTVTPDGYTLNQDGSWNTNIAKVDSNKTMATGVNNSGIVNDSSSTNETVTTETEDKSDSTSTTKKKKSSSSSSNSSSNNTNNIVNPRDYFVVYYLEDTSEVVRVKVSNEADAYSRDGKLCPYMIIKWSDLNIGTLEETSKNIIYNYEVKDGKLMKRNEEKETVSDDTLENITVTTDSQVTI